MKSLSDCAENSALFPFLLIVKFPDFSHNLATLCKIICISDFLTPEFLAAAYKAFETLCLLPGGIFFERAVLIFLNYILFDIGKLIHELPEISGHFSLTLPEKTQKFSD